MKGVDLRFLFGHLLWIVGATVLLSVYSYCRWRAGVDGRPVREALGEWRHVTALGLLTVATAFLVLPAIHWLETTAWLAVWLGAASRLMAGDRRP